ncbi:hypothetical protein BN2476_780016 [Paraburkholderia piptadeniae]|uniref:Uncharacterized protein n=1 Tax=Paraburkholderia piptadeniae TaxID=1701573 RepID=A0A1N7SSP6_9BURK|nr:hypothetical protein BN2476_780016 [Paraburkholderia piptadeniae]
MPIRQRRGNLRKFLARSPDDWIFESFSKQLVSHRVRQYFAGELPDLPTIGEAAISDARSARCAIRAHLTARSATARAARPAPTDGPSTLGDTPGGEARLSAVAEFVTTWAGLDSLRAAYAGTIGYIVTAWPVPFRASWQLSIDRLVGRSP